MLPPMNSPTPCQYGKENPDNYFFMMKTKRWSGIEHSTRIHVEAPQRRIGSERVYQYRLQKENISQKVGQFRLAATRISPVKLMWPVYLAFCTKPMKPYPVNNKCQHQTGYQYDP
jgi:hypothetical protein